MCHRVELPRILRGWVLASALCSSSFLVTACGPHGLSSSSSPLAAVVPPCVSSEWVGTYQAFDSMLVHTVVLAPDGRFTREIRGAGWVIHKSGIWAPGLDGVYVLEEGAPQWRHFGSDGLNLRWPHRVSFNPTERDQDDFLLLFPTEKVEVFPVMSGD